MKKTYLIFGKDWKFILLFFLAILLFIFFYILPDVLAISGYLAIFSLLLAIALFVILLLRSFANKKKKK